MNLDKLTGRHPKGVSRVFKKHGINAPVNGKNLFLAVVSKPSFAGDLYDELNPFSGLDGDDERKASFVSDLRNAALAIVGLGKAISGKGKADTGTQNPMEPSGKVISFKTGMIIGISVIIILTIILVYLKKRK